MPAFEVADFGVNSNQIQRYDAIATVVSHKRVVYNGFEIVLYAPDIARNAKPGQFVMLLFGQGYSADVRRPFSLFRADNDSGTITIYYLARGSFTSELAQKRPGDTVSLIGPLGRPFSWLEVRNTRHVLVAGGIGAPPIYFLAREITRWRDACPDAKVTIQVINAARTAELLVGEAEFEQLDLDLRVVTGDGSSGQQGIATEVLQNELEISSATQEVTRIYACGPMAMLRSVGALGVSFGLSCQLSIETAMPCGVGECDGCAVHVIDPQSPTGYSVAKACVDGPVFESKRLAWDL
jgi:dihydroorotate dehydrogenase electron transfer subunit